MMIYNIVNTTLPSYIRINRLSSVGDVSGSALLHIRLDVEVSEEIEEENSIEAHRRHEIVGRAALGDAVADHNMDEHETELHLENVNG